MITIDTASQKVILKIEGFEHATRRALELGSHKSGKRLFDVASNEILRGKKTGRLYKVRLGKRTRRHRASAAGESHANITGKLRRSMSHKVLSDGLEFGYGVTKNNAPEYGQHLEFGTKNMKPRPTIQNAIRASEADMHGIYAKEIVSEIV